MLVSDVARRVKAIVGDTNNIFIKDNDIIDWINDGMLEICRDTDCLTGTDSNSALDFASDGVTLPTDRIRTKRVTYVDVSQLIQPLKFITIEELDNLEIPSNLFNTNTPLFYYFNDGKLWLYPQPSSTDTATINHYYSKTPTNVANTGDSVGIPAAYNSDLIRFVTSRAHERDQNYRAAQLTRAEYDANLPSRKDEAGRGEDSYLAVREWDADY